VLASRKRILYSLHITEIYYIECTDNHKNTNFLFTETVHLNSKEWLFSGNYQLLDEESNRRMEFCRELQVLGRGIHRKNGILPEITGS
jgi:hypothetical protein